MDNRHGIVSDCDGMGYVSNSISGRKFFISNLAGYLIRIDGSPFLKGSSESRRELSQNCQDNTVSIAALAMTTESRFLEYRYTWSESRSSTGTSARLI